MPAFRDDFDGWVIRTVLNPAIPLFREACSRYLLAEETDIRLDPALYNSVPAPSPRNVTRGGIANYVGRKSSDVMHPLTVLEDAGLIIRESDPFHARKSMFWIAEPLITFYGAVMLPAWTPAAGAAAGRCGLAASALHLPVQRGRPALRGTMPGLGRARGG